MADVIEKIVELSVDKDLTPEQIRSAIVRVHNGVVTGQVSTAQATQALRALELYATVSGMLVKQQAAERKTTATGFQPG